MKNISVNLTLGLFAFLCVSCTDDSKTNYVQKNYLSGKWVTSKIGHVDTDGYVIYETYNNDSCESDNVVFNDDKTFLLSDFEFSAGTCNTYSIDGTYTLEGTNIVLSYTNDAGIEINESRIIKSLSFTEMEIAYTDSVTNEIVLVKLVKE